MQDLTPIQVKTFELTTIQVKTFELSVQLLKANSSSGSLDPKGDKAQSLEALKPQVWKSGASRSLKQWVGVAGSSCRHNSLL